MEICNNCGHELEKVMERHPYGDTTATETWWTCTNLDCNQNNNEKEND